MSERRGTKGLELWCRRMTEGYPGVNVVNMTTSWRDGLAFCAIIHHFRPDLIEFSKLNKDDIYHNNELAFRIAERHLGIPALLEPEDMVECQVPDRLSILTYLSQFYQTFAVSQGKSPNRIAPKRPAASPEHNIGSPTSSSPPTKAATPGAIKLRREPCAKCNLPVFIAERLNVGKLLYHRTCFRCARCHSQLTLANYYETENGEFCCESCPDEDSYTKPKSFILAKSLSDEEKSASLKSETFESAELSSSRSFSDARSSFVRSQVEEDPPDLPESKPPEVSDAFSDSGFPKFKSVNKVSDNTSHDIVTKETISAEGESLVQARMRLFETKADLTNETQVSRFSDSYENSARSDALSNDEEKKDSVITVSSESAAPDSVISVSSKTDNSVIIISDEEHEDKLKLPEVKDEASEVASMDVSSGMSSIAKNEEEKSVPSHQEEELISEEESRILEQPNLEEIAPIATEKESILVSSVASNEDEYPEDLNPFGEESMPEAKYVNPFEEEEEQEQASPPSPKPKPIVRKKIKPLEEDKVPPRYTGTNPFEEEEDEEEPKKKIISAPRVTLTPFWSDDEEDKESKPVPKPRLSKGSSEASPRPSASSTTSCASSSSTGKKKKPAPRPPTESGPSSVGSSPCQSVTQSPRSTPKIRKAKRAPLPPTSTPEEGRTYAQLDLGAIGDFENEKGAKDEQNKMTQNSIAKMEYISHRNKDEYGRWKKKKGQAPPIPAPQRRVDPLPIEKVQSELKLIEVQQQGLEKQGVKLEQIIRERCEYEGSDDTTLPNEVDEMILQLFEIVNEKNELFRRQTELMYLRKEHKLQQTHADIERQIRDLMRLPEAQKTDSHKAREEELINQLVEVVEKRNEIIDCLEMDRRREVEEDESISNQMILFSAKKEEQKVKNTKSSKKEKKKHKKEKKMKIKHDADKDIDESECSSTSSLKEKKKKKFALF